MTYYQSYKTESSHKCAKLLYFNISAMGSLSLIAEFRCGFEATDSVRPLSLDAMTLPSSASPQMMN